MQPEKIDTIAVMGTGIVGGSLLAHLQEQGRDVRAYDPPKGLGSLDDLAEADAVFVCVPTPYTNGRGFDDSFLLSALNHIPGKKLVVIKSTVLPGTTDLMQERFQQHRFMFNPEFLREATALEDFLRPDRQIVGVTPKSRSEAPAVMAMLPRAPFERICPASEAEMAKYVANSFLAVKVSYSNDIFDLCQRLAVDYGTVRDIVAADVRIGTSHMDVLDSGYRGYGGKCLPKDSKSLLDLASAAGVELTVLRAADRVNAVLRGEENGAVRTLRPVAPVIATDAEEQAA
jgi:UDPglucose 6-dehydrogenase